MSHFGNAVEYALHIVTQLAMNMEGIRPSAKTLAEFQGVPSAYLAKIMTKLQKAHLVKASEGKGGGYQLALPADEITFLHVTDAIEGKKKLFDCKEVRQRCVLNAGRPLKTSGIPICSIHAVMQSAERSMRERLAETTIADIVRQLNDKFPPETKATMRQWFEDHSSARTK